MEVPEIHNERKFAEQALDTLLIDMFSSLSPPSPSFNLKRRTRALPLAAVAIGAI